MNNIFALWCHPRSMSTAIERLMHAHGDLECLHEPFMYFYYIDQRKRTMPYFNPDSQQASTYDGVKKIILSKAQSSPVFFKDMSYYVTSHILNDADFCHQITHSFLIRHPKASIASYYTLDNNVTLEEIGYEAQWILYEKLTSLGIHPTILQAESVRAHPKETVSEWWTKLKLRFNDTAFTWDKHYPSAWDAVKGWHEKAIASSSIHPPADNQKALEKARFEQVLDAAPHLQHYLEHHQPFYEKLKNPSLKNH